MQHRIRVLCVDDHQLVLEGIESTIAREADMEIAASAATGEQAVELFRRHRPDVTLMDLQLPRMSGLEAIRAIRSECPDALILVLTMYQGDEDIYQALRAGAATYLLKDTLSDELVHMIRKVHAGERALPLKVASVLASRDEHPILTPREAEVIKLIAKGLRNKEIAYVLGISEQTAKVHVKSILAKFGVTDRTAAVNIALQRGIIHMEYL